MAKKIRRATAKWISRSKAFALGLSGAGLLVTCPNPVHALNKGDTVGQAWANVGKHLNRAAIKVADERRKTSGRE